jgi:hypothetical protein
MSSCGRAADRFAFGTAGVFWTENFGVEWFPILKSIALPGRPESGFFDPLWNQSDRALYVDCEGRSILRSGGRVEGPTEAECKWASSARRRALRLAEGRRDQS